VQEVRVETLAKIAIVLLIIAAIVWFICPCSVTISVKPHPQLGGPTQKKHPRQNPSREPKCTPGRWSKEIVIPN
jgi:hypothetical protein